MVDKAKFNIQSVSQNSREVSCWRRCTARNFLHLHQENRLRFSNSKNCKNSNSRPILSAFHLYDFLLSPSRLFALNIKPPLRFAWKPKNAPRRNVRRNDVNRSLVATSLLSNSGYQRDLWPKQNWTPLAILARQNCKLASLAAFVELAGAGATGKALSFFQILNIGKNSRVDKSKIISFKNIISFLYSVVFCQHFARLHSWHDSADLHQLLKS